MLKKESSLNKKDILITKRKGSFIRKCPGTKGYTCCDYYVLNLGIGCSFNCTYCFLHHYMNTPFTAYSNIEEAIEEVRRFCLEKSKSPSPLMGEGRGEGERIVRMGSGEFIDSVGFDEIANYNATLVPALSKIDNLLFEIKTKSHKIDHLLNLEHNGRVVVSWSLNPQEIIDKEESGASSLHQRLEAAKKCQDAGYKIGFHFDPLIYYIGWQEGYKQVVDMLFESIEPKNIAWISLGALRFNPSLKSIIQKKFPESKIIYAEMVPGLDGKLRYFIAIRKKLFKTLMNYTRSYSEEVPIYLCMESKELAQEIGAIDGFSISRGRFYG